ncbi:hypothetical protein PspLS_08788 [Pyricularia sp. CBS 133598]|nr:hypothetical protein PspLS_08788 [Pyricularia sp. CBS 133598]
MAAEITLTAEELGRHQSPDDCWIAVHKKVWDVTEFLDEHPGGSEIILQYAGKDATAAYDGIHAPGMLEETLAPEKFKGTFIPATSDSAPPGAETEAIEMQQTPAPTNNNTLVPYRKPDLYSNISAEDFRDVASHTFTAKTWAFYSSAATDLNTHGWNQSFLRRIMLRPRVLRDVAKTSMRRKILGYDSAVPFFISPAAMARLAHPEGEMALARGAAKEGVIQCISNNASYPLSAIASASDSLPADELHELTARPRQTFFFQLYVNHERHKTADLLRKARDLGIKAIFVTVDAPVPGKREADERIAAEAIASAVSGAVASNDKKGGGMGRLMAAYVEKRLIWEDIAWIKEVSGLPVILKGVQSAEDARLAVKYGCEGIMLSNHGGRSLDTSQPAILVLLELHKYCPEVFDHLEVIVDGGFQRGSDILKAICLGATAVGIGRPFLYSLAYGEEGCAHLCQILKDELEVSMKLCGINSLDEAHPGLVNTADIEHLVRSAEDHPWIKWKPKARL